MTNHRQKKPKKKRRALRHSRLLRKRMQKNVGSKSTHDKLVDRLVAASIEAQKVPRCADPTCMWGYHVPSEFTRSLWKARGQPMNTQKYRRCKR